MGSVDTGAWELVHLLQLLGLGRSLPSGTGLFQQPLCNSLVPIIHEESLGLSGGPHFSLGALSTEAAAVHEGTLPPSGNTILLTAEIGSHQFPFTRFPLMT